MEIKFKTTLFFLILSWGIFPQDNIPEEISQPESQNEKSQENEENSATNQEKLVNTLAEEVRADQAIMIEIADNIADFKESYEDSKLLQNKKKKQYAQKLAAINHKYQGQEIQFKHMCVQEVEPQTELTSYGQGQVKKFISQLKKDPQYKMYAGLMGGDDLKDNPILQMAIGFQLMACKKCFRETGKYEVKFITPHGDVSDGTELSSICSSNYGQEFGTVIKIVNSESAALKFEKNNAYPVKGVIRSINIELAYSGAKTTIHLK